MSMYEDIVDDDGEPFIAPTLRSKKKSSELGVGVCTNRVIILLLVALLAAGGICFQSELTEQANQIRTEESTILKLQEVIKGHEEVIQRFNTSVTNSDVMDQLHDLKVQLRMNQKDLTDQVNYVKLNVEAQLKDTMDQLNRTVAEAEGAINAEVEMVKADVESYVRTTQDQFSMENSFMVYQLAGTFTLLSCLISMWHMTAHLRKFNEPTVQRKILAILWMCPIYAITSWFSLVFRPAEGYLAIIKDFYEAYVIYQFLSFCIAVLGRGDREAVVQILTKHASHLSPPFRFDSLCNKNPYDSDRALAGAVLLQCQSFAMQFVFLKPTTTLAAFVLDKIQYYGPTGNPMDYRSPQVYIVGLQNLSVFIAFTGLLKFYHAVDKDLAWCRPFAKFLCIKGVVFMTFWQGLAISVLAQTTDVGGNDSSEWARSAQNFLICLEMLLFSIAHFYTFPTDEWEEGYRASHEGGKFGDTIALGDFFQDLKLILQTQKKKKKKKSDDDSLATLDEAEEEDEEDLMSTSNGGSVYDEEKAIKDLKEALQDADEDTCERMGALADRIPDDGADAVAARSTVGGDDDQYDPDAPMGQYSGGSEPAWMAAIKEVDELVVSERTSLLSPQHAESSLQEIRSPNEQLLRPSIFTTLSEVARTNPYTNDEK
ncbi:Organic solute transporter Ostalpha [Fragilaria crotonensis]|nr:Organic solute transporter Ostalpha [Fragilaria crotonensis]